MAQCWSVRVPGREVSLVSAMRLRHLGPPPFFPTRGGGDIRLLFMLEPLVVDGALVEALSLKSP